MLTFALGMLAGITSVVAGVVGYLALAAYLAGRQERERAISERLDAVRRGW